MTTRVPSPTARLEFREWRPDDLERALGLWGDPRVTARIDARPRLSPADVQARLDREMACARDHRVQYWPMFLRDGGAHVGCCGLRPYDLEQRIYELGFHVCADHWRRGYAEEAARSVIALAFAGLAAALFAGHHPDNAASRALLLRLGFRHTHDERYPPTGLMHPSYLLAPG